MAVGAFIGVIILSAFAVVWVGIGTRSLRLGWWTGLTLLSALVSITIAAVALRVMLVHPLPPGISTTTRQLHLEFYWISVAFEAVAIPIAVFALKRTGRQRYILPTIAFLVGLHFFGLVAAFSSIEFAWLGGSMCCLALLTVALLPPNVGRNTIEPSKPVDLWALIIGAGCAAFLWAFAIHALI